MKSGENARVWESWMRAPVKVADASLVRVEHLEASQTRSAASHFTLSAI